MYSTVPVPVVLVLFFLVVTFPSFFLFLPLCPSFLSIFLQEPVLFSGTIAENLTYSRQEILQLDESARDALLWRVAEQANAHTFIKSFPAGLNTEIGEHGIQLSGMFYTSIRAAILRPSTPDTFSVLALTHM